MGLFSPVDGTSDPVVTRIVDEDPVPWYKKPNLRILYLVLFPACVGIEVFCPVFLSNKAETTR
jgi:hypothetical protein